MIYSTDVPGGSPGTLGKQSPFLWLRSPDALDADALVAKLVNRPAWHAKANCRGKDHRMFFATTEATAEVLALCWRCPVSGDCLNAALEDPTTVGVWGGTTESMRRAMPQGGVTKVAGTKWTVPAITSGLEIHAL
jgi:WhiB family redox-sensing transcriptional regulator